MTEIKNVYGEVIFTSASTNHTVGRAVHMALKAGVNLQYADLVDADLVDADLTGADLTGADLTGADLEGADLRGAILEGAKLRGTIFDL